MAKTAVLLINLGTPDSPRVSDVRRYLTQFLNDPRVIDIPWLARKLLVNGIIVPFRAPKSAKIYKQLWTEKGSPILVYGNSVKEKVQTALGEDYIVELGMRYQNPSIATALEKLRQHNPTKLILLTLFPHYASASTGSALEEALNVIRKWWVIPELAVNSQYWDHEGYINAFVERGMQYDHREYDHVIFSYHGLPERQVDKVYGQGLCSDRDCEHEVNDENRFCYKATCYGTSRILAGRLGIPQERYTVSFQSRLDKNWIRPFSDEVIQDLAGKGAKKLLVFSPAFTADCLETVIEIGVEYQELFEEYGGEKVQLVESLNDHPLWINALTDMIKSYGT